MVVTGSESTDLEIGDRVRCERAAPSRGSWRLYNGREGWVSAIKRQRFRNGGTYVEIGVDFVNAPSSNRNPSAGSWFRADELIRVDR